MWKTLVKRKYSALIGIIFPTDRIQKRTMKLVLIILPSKISCLQAISRWRTYEVKMFSFSFYELQNKSVRTVDPIDSL